MRSDIGIDMGSAYTRIFRNKKICLNQPSVITVDTATEQPVAYGEKAYNMIGRTSERFISVCPIERGAIADFDAAEMMITHYSESLVNSKIVRPRVTVSVPGGITPVQQRSVMDAMESAGMRNVRLVEAPVAAAVGLDIDFMSPKGVTILDIGKGTTDIAVLSLGGLARCESIKIAGCDFDQAIIRYVRRKHGIDIGELTAEKIKKKVGTLVPRNVEIGYNMSGLNIFSGLPKSFEITTTEILEVMTETADELVREIQAVFEGTSPEMVADTSRDGIYLIGGGALLYGMEKYLSDRLRLDVKLQDDPLNCVVKGLGKASDNATLMRSKKTLSRKFEHLSAE